MTELNDVRYQVKNKTANTFELGDEETGDDVSTTLSSAYASGGYVRKCATVFSGLDHLEGETVGILGNGFVYPQAVVDGGTVTLSSACSRVHIGLPYFADLWTLDINTMLRSGTTQGTKKSIGEVVFQVINSRGGYIGPDSDNLFEAFTPERLSLGDTPDLYTGLVREKLSSGVDDEAKVFYRQVDPLPITISSIVMMLETGE
jgi:hypothetical protein